MCRPLSGADTNYCVCPSVCTSASTFRLIKAVCAAFWCYKYIMKKAPRETQTLRAGCSKAEPKSFAPLQTPFPGARDGQNLISWRWSLPLLTNPVWWDRCTQFPVIVVIDPQTNKHTNPQTHKHIDRGDYNTRRR